jgi:hypothetical protein
MMLMLRILILFCLASPALLFGQTNEWTKQLTWSSTYSIAEDFQLQRVISNHKGFYVIRADKRRGSPVFIDTYSEELELQHQIGFDPTNRGKEWQFERLVRLRDTFYLFSTQLQENQLQHTLYYESIIPDSTQQFRLDKQAAIQTISMPMRNQSGDFEVLVDKDETHCLVITTSPLHMEEKSYSIR